MDKDSLLKDIAETGYNVGFGGRKHFATYDIVDKTPGLISFLSMAFGTYALVFDGLSTEFLSASFVVLGIIGLYISFYDSRKSDYEKAGTALTRLFNELRQLYRSTKSANNDALPEYKQKLNDIEIRYYETCISKQILFSDWYAHYKFFWQVQIDWIDEQKNFKLLRDKIPLTFSLTVILAVAALIFWGSNFLNLVCRSKL
jgi:SMODS and SLOG-associating 2TM effector domain 6